MSAHRLIAIVVCLVFLLCGTTAISVPFANAQTELTQAELNGDLEESSGSDLSRDDQHLETDFDTSYQLVQEQNQDSKWPSPPTPSTSKPSPSKSDDPTESLTKELPKKLFHFFRLEDEPTRGKSADSSTLMGKSKGEDGISSERSADINALVVSRDGRHAFAGMDRGKLFELEFPRENLETSSGKSKKSGKNTRVALRKHELLGGTEPILGLALSKNERFIGITRFGLVQVFDRRAKKVIAELTKVSTRLVATDWDPRSELLVVGGVGGDMYTWNVFDGPAAGRDSLDAVENYAGESPVVDLLFHPAARGFFAAQQNGGVLFWRLLRTERELGLRDEGAKIDAEKKGRMSSTIGTLSSRPEQIWLEEGGETLFVSAADGKIYRWRVRGLEKETEIFVGTDQVSNVTQLPFVVSSRYTKDIAREIRPFFTSGRGQRLAIFCPKAPDEKLTFASVSVVSSNSNPVVPSPAAILVDGRIEETPSPNPTPTPVPNSSVPIVPMAETDRFDSPLSSFASGADSAVLWATQKGGTLVVFDATQLKQAEWLQREFARCLSQAGK